MNENEKNTQKVGAYASLTGFRRAVPFILAALALFTALCFITQKSGAAESTGALGRWFADFLLGTFSIGGYAIPALLGIHAIFYASDVLKKRTLSRVIFSVIAVVFMSAVTHVAYNFNVKFEYSASTFYSDGIALHGGGFVGGSVAFVLTRAFGSVGFIIITCLIVALYATYFLAGGKNAFLKGLLKVLNAMSSGVDRMNAKKKAKLDEKTKKENEKQEKKLEKRQAKEAKLLAARHEPLEDDEFFAADNGMKELKIKELGIIEERSDEEIEFSPTLQEKVIHKKAESENCTEEARTEKTASGTFEDISEEKPKEEQRRRRVNMDYSGIDGKRGYSTSVKDSTFSEGGESIVYEARTKSSGGFAAREECAEDVFGSDFGAFDFKLEESLASKPSSKTEQQEAKATVDEGVCEVISEISEEDIENARRRADLEMKKRAKEEAERRFASARGEITRDTPTEQSYTFGYAPSYTEKKEEPARNSYAAQAASGYSSVGATAGYTAAVKEEKKEPTLEDKLALAQERYRRAAEIANMRDSYAQEESTTFKSYSTESFAQESVEARQESKETLKAERSVISESEESFTFGESEAAPYTEEKASYTFGERMREESHTEAKSDSSSLEFDFTLEESEDEEENVLDAISGAEEDGLAEGENIGPLGYEEIPEEEQNPDILNLRKLYSVLDGDGENEDDTEDYAEQAEFKEEEEEEDALPFDAPTRVVGSVKEKEKKDEPAVSERPDYSNYKYPSTDLLLQPKTTEADEHQNEEINENADNLVNTLQQFGVRVSVKGVDRGPRITRYEIVPAMGVKVQSVMSLYNDIVLNLGAEGVRMEAPIPGRKAIGVEIPNKNPATVYLRELVENDTFRSSNSKTLACLGKDVTGKPIFEDIAKMPHVLVAGATGMGKSVCINAVLISILYKASPDDVRFIMIDPKKVEFKRYNGIPHLLVPVVTDVKQAAGALMWAVEQMEKRYDLMEELGVSKLDAYNEMVRQNPELGTPLPKIIIVIDELNDIMIQVRKPAEDLIMSIAQKARAAGIHLIIGTQRPSVNVVTGTIKANIPSRISCKVASFQDSKTILEQSGAEKLLNNGDMLYITSGTPKPVRVQGAYVSDGEVAAVMKFLKSQANGEIYDAQALDEINRAAQKCSKGKGGADDFDDDDDDSDRSGILNDQQFLDAVDVALRSGKISTSLLQRKIKIGFGKAARYIDEMEDLGIVSGPNAQKAREVLISSDEWHEMLARRSLD